jgi:Carboxypeptidase regulatory-like domain/Peptidase family M1 domain
MFLRCGRLPIAAGAVLVAVAALSHAAPAPAIAGSVKDPSGAPIAGAHIECSPVSAAGEPRSAATDTAGIFRMDGLTPGRYRIRVAQPGFAPFEREVTVGETGDAGIEIRLEIAAPRESLVVKGGPQAHLDPVYAAMRDSTIADTLLVENLVLRRDNALITLKSGTIAFAAKAMGRDTVAVFSGEGELAFDPVPAMEKAYLKSVTGDDSMRETFDRALFCFTDRTGEEIRGQAKAQPAQPRLADILKEYRRHLRTRPEPRSLTDALVHSETMDNVEADILTDLYNPSQTGFFSAYLHGRKHADLRFHVKPRGVLPDLSPEEVGLINLDPGTEQDGILCLSHLKQELAASRGLGKEDHRTARAESYTIDTVIGKNDHFVGASGLRFRAVNNGDRVIKFGLLPSLRVTRVSQDGKDIAFIQEDRREDGSFYAIMPAPMPAGEEHQLLIEYQGDRVVYKEGGGNFSVGARESWYPVLNTFRDYAKYHLTFRVPKQYTLVSVGKLAREWKEQDYACTEWTSEAPMPVAGFNYGNFKKKQLADADTGVQIEGYAAAEAPDYLAGAQMDGTMGSLSPVRLMEGTLVDAENALRLFTAWFGKSEFGRIAITQQPQFNFGQSWPTLVYLPMSAYLDSTQRWRLMGHINTRLSEFVDEVTPHEVSHQWWGHMVGWSSYRDQWLSEGFAFFSAGLFLQLTQKTPDKAVAYWQHAREMLLEKNNFGRRTNDAGPLTMGLRLSTHKNEGGYSAVVYRKGGYILHMLHCLMFDSKTGNKPFIDMMHDFVEQNMNRAATTEDFQRVAEKHMPSTLNVRGDGKLDWFFNEWVYGTAVPKYKFDYTVNADSDGKWLLEASLTQSDVPDDFIMPVPIYADLDGRTGMLGLVRMAGNTTVNNIKAKLPVKPRKVMINALHDVLEQ